MFDQFTSMASPGASTAQTSPDAAAPGFQDPGILSQSIEALTGQDQQRPEQAGLFPGAIAEVRDAAQDAAFASKHPVANHALESFTQFSDNLGDNKGQKMALAGAGVGALGVGAYEMRNSGLARTAALAGAAGGVGLWAHNKLDQTPQHEQGLGQMTSTLFGSGVGAEIASGAQSIGGRLMQEGRELGIPVDNIAGGLKHAGSAVLSGAEHLGGQVSDKAHQLGAEYGKPMLSHVQDVANETFDMDAVHRATHQQEASGHSI